MVDETTFQRGATVKVDGHEGIAWNVLGPEMEPDEDTEWTGYEVPTGLVECVMVGDDSIWRFDPTDLTLIDEEAFCHGCGQIGCGW